MAVNLVCRSWHIYQELWKVECVSNFISEVEIPGWGWERKHFDEGLVMLWSFWKEISKANSCSTSEKYKLETLAN